MNVAVVPADPDAVARLQRRTLIVLAVAQVLGGLGMGSTLSLGALLIEDVSNTPALSGLAATMLTLGTALASFPLGRLAASRGRRTALTTGAAAATIGAALVIIAPALDSLALVLAGMVVLGSGSAAGLQSRFAAADLATPRRRGRDLSMVVWATTVGVVIGPNLLQPGEALGAALGLHPLTGAFVFTLTAQLLVVLLIAVWLRPDPLLTAIELTRRERRQADAERSVTTEPAVQRPLRAVLRERPAATVIIIVIALSHAVMVSVMAMTPLHLTQHAASLSVVGIVISLHTAGMYALSPVFGWMSDRFGRMRTLVLGQALLAAALMVNWAAQGDHATVGVALTLLGLGWSAATVAGSALLTETLEPADRPRVQGLSDTVMSLSAAVGGALAGVIVALAGYGVLNLGTLGLVAIVGALLAVRSGTLVNRV